ncbi:hypothetical protein [Sphingomonas sp. S2-65]|uniref:hypothetical protein n=1 Tax=Sphingomonas sp. S2-65 TaxID=2903960 RepID=UPI001F29833B|nr:hypothetical protein [Sphingomonas sp. S2-65]UYY59323.1 hypothetical protein LZ586_04330 [Sphingomonas sp. S2-65]
MDENGVIGTAGGVGALALMLIAGFFMTGASARISEGLYCDRVCRRESAGAL